MGINLFSNWLWEKLTKHNIKKVSIDSIDVRFDDKGEIRRIIAEGLKIEE